MKKQESLRNVENYLGIFKFSELKKLTIKQYPCYFMLKHKHIFVGIAIYINDIYICDPSGAFECKTLLNYLPLLCYNKNIFITKRLQSKPQKLYYVCSLFIQIMSKDKGFDKFLNLFLANLKNN